MVAEAPNVTEVMEKVNAYQAFQRKEGIPVVTGFGVEDLRTIEVKPWARKGGLGTYINLDGTGGTNDAYVCEIPPGESLDPQHHIYEQFTLILQGRGATEVWQKDGPKRTFEWGKGSLFAPPKNCYYRMINVGREPVLDLVAALNRILGTNLTPTFAQTRAGDVKFSKADIRRTRLDLGYNPTVSFEAGLRQTVEWYLATQKVLCS